MYDTMNPSPEPVFSFKSQPLKPDYLLWGFLCSIPALLLAYDPEKEKILQELLFFVGGFLFGYGLSRFFQWLQHKDYRFTFHSGHLEFFDIYLGTKKKIRGRLDYSNVRVVTEVPGRGVAVALRDPDLFFTSFGPYLSTSEGWKNKDRRVKARFQADLWIENEVIGGKAHEFAEELEPRRRRASLSQIPAPEPLEVFSWNSKAEFRRAAIVLVLFFLAAVGGAVFLAESGLLGKGNHGLMVSVLVGVLATAVLSQVRSSRLRLILGPRELTLQDGRTGVGVESRVSYADIQEVKHVRGKGVGLKLFQTGPWLATLDGAENEKKLVIRKQEQWKTSKGIDFWIPERSLCPDPEKFVQILNSRLAPAAPVELDFDKAVFRGTAAPLKCRACGKPIQGEYWELNHFTVCPVCKKAGEDLRGKSGGIKNILMAILLGGLGGLVAGGLFLWVTLATDKIFGLLTLLVGWLVGGGVRKGAHRQGGWVYQTIAVGITYVVISAVIIGVVLAQTRSIMKNSNFKKPAASMGAPQTPSAAGTPLATPQPSIASQQGVSKQMEIPVHSRVKTPLPSSSLSTKEAQTPALAGRVETPNAPVSANATAPLNGPKADIITLAGPNGAQTIYQFNPRPKPKVQARSSLGWDTWLIQAMSKGDKSILVRILILILGILVCLVYAFVLAFQNSAITGALFCFGLWEAWRMNKRQPFLLKGPFHLGNPASPGSEAPSAIPPQVPS